MNEEQIAKIKESLDAIPEHKLDSIIAEVTKLTDHNIDPQEIFPVGIINPDRAEVNIVVRNEDLEPIRDFLLNNPNRPTITDLSFFPVGIIRQDWNKIKFKVGQ